MAPATVGGRDASRHEAPPQADLVVQRSLWDDITSMAQDTPVLPMGIPNPLAIGHDINALFGEPPSGDQQKGQGQAGQGSLWDRGVNWVENTVATGAHDLAKDVADVPVLGAVANAGADMISTDTEMLGGIAKGAGTFVGGVGSMLEHPLQAAEGLEKMAEHIPFIPGTPNPLKLAHGLYDVATGQEGLGDMANHVFNPLQSMKDDAAFGEQMAKGIIKPYQQEINQGKYAEAVGRGVFDIGSIILTAGGGAGAEGAADVARGAEVAGELTEGAGALTKAGEAGGDLARLGEGGGSAKTVLEPHPFEAGEGGLRPVEPAPAEFPIPETPGAGQPASGLQTVDDARIAREVARQGRAIRVRDIRAAARDVKGQDLSALRDQGLVDREFVDLADDVGLDQAQALAEGKAGLKEAGAEVSHEPFPLQEGPELGDKAENLRIRGKEAHRVGIHGRQFNKGSEFQPVDPAYAEHEPFQSTPQPGQQPLSPAQIDQAVEDASAEQWADREDAINELIDRSRGR